MKTSYYSSRVGSLTRLFRPVVLAMLAGGVPSLGIAQTPVTCNGNDISPSLTSGATLFISAGTCRAAASLSSGTHLVGVPGKTILQPANSSGPILTVSGTSSSYISNVTIEGITFDAAGAQINPINTAYVTNLRLVNNIFTTSSGSITGGNAINMTDTDGQIESNEISGYQFQIQAFVDVWNGVPLGHGLTIAHNHLHDSAGGNGIYIWGNPSSPTPIPYPVTVDGNYIENTPVASWDTNQGPTGNSVVVFSVYGVRISNNYADNPRYSCYRINTGWDVLITNNHCSNAGEAGAYSEFGAQHNEWVNNYFDSIQATCLSLTNFSNSTPGQENTAIGNHFKNCGLQGGNGGNCSNGGFFPAAIHVEGYAVVSGNIIDRVSVSAGGGTGIRLGYCGTGYAVLVKDNIITSAAVGIGVEVTSGALIVEGNQIAYTTTPIAGTNSGTSPGPLPAGVTIRNQTMNAAMLGTPDDGSFVYCSDCGANSTGAFARRANGNWLYE